jgi:hypothetical protein
LCSGYEYLIARHPRSLLPTLPWRDDVAGLLYPDSSAIRTGIVIEDH